MPGSSLLTLRRIALAGMFAGLAWGAGYVESIPNFELQTVMLFAGGWALGPFGGAAAGAVGAFLFSAFNPYGSGLMYPLLLVSQMLGMALAGAVGGVVGGLGIVPPVPRWIAVVGSGIVVTLLYDLLTNVASGLAFGQLRATLIAGAGFSLFHIATNAVLFASVGVLLVRALERTRRSLAPPRAGNAAPAAFLIAAGLVALAALGGGAGDGWAQGALPTPAEAAAADSAHADSVAYRDASRSAPGPAWGDGPAGLLRRDAGSLSHALTLEGAFVERFADDRGSAEPSGRFGLAGANRVLVDWLGMPLTGVGAVGGEYPRVPWATVSSFEAPGLPVSATEAYRGELGQVTLGAWPAVPGHPRVEAWANFGSPRPVQSGFNASGSAGHVDGVLAVESSRLDPLEPLGLEGDHNIAGRLAGRGGPWSGNLAYRVSQQSIEDASGRHERRQGEAGRGEVRRDLGALAAALSFERTAETFEDTGVLVGLTTERGRGGRATLRVESDADSGRAPAQPMFAAFTYGKETLEGEGNVAFEPRASSLWWVSAGRAFAFGGVTAQAAIGAGAYGDGPADVAPSLRVGGTLASGTAWWAGAARGLSAAPDMRAGDAFGDPLVGDARVARSSTWLSGVGVARDTPGQESWRGPAPHGALHARAAVYAGRTSPGADPGRWLFAGESAENAPLSPVGDATRFVALALTSRWSPWAGFTLGAGGHALGRSVDGALTPSDPEARAYLSLEERHTVGRGAPDLRLGVTGEWIGPRTGTPAGDLPAALRLGLQAGAIIDEFELRASWANVAGSNRLLPVEDPATSAPLPAGHDLLRIELRWTFWD